MGKTVEQALMEVLEEEEIGDLRAQQRRFLELRAAEKAEEQRLEEEEKRLAEEKVCCCPSEIVCLVDGTVTRNDSFLSVGKTNG